MLTALQRLPMGNVRIVTFSTLNYVINNLLKFGPRFVEHLPTCTLPFIFYCYITFIVYNSCDLSFV